MRYCFLESRCHLKRIEPSQGDPPEPVDPWSKCVFCPFRLLCDCSPYRSEVSVEPEEESRVKV